MDHEDLVHLRNHHAAWRLLCADNAPLVLAFLSRAYIDANADSIASPELEAKLDDELYALRASMGDDAYPRSPCQYLDDWTERTWLRKHYISGSDDAHYSLSPAVEKAAAWVRDLPRREFIGTESRLRVVFELLRQMVHGTESDPQSRLDELHHRRGEIDAEIARVERGEFEMLDPVELRDRYQQASRTARELLADFREVEENFRRLDRTLRERIAGWEGSKGELLEEILGHRAGIAESDQGRSFRAFYDFLLSAARREELTELLARVQELGIEGGADRRLERIHFDWIDASERTQATVRLLSEQLRRFLDDKVWLENRRVFDLLRSIEAKARRLRDTPRPTLRAEIESPKVPIVLPTERPLYRRKRPEPLDSAAVAQGSGEFDSEALTDQVVVDREMLAGRVLATLGPRSQVGLEEVIDAEPLEVGLAELIGYLSLREPAFDVVFDDDRRFEVRWTPEDRRGEIERVASGPQVLFARESTENAVFTDDVSADHVDVDHVGTDHG